jgi:hypothetical protein
MRIARTVTLFSILGHAFWSALSMLTNMLQQEFDGEQVLHTRIDVLDITILEEGLEILIAVTVGRLPSSPP